MDKIRRFLGILATLIVVAFTGNAMAAAGYVCPDYQVYVSCSAGYYLTRGSGSSLAYSNDVTTPGNTCTKCPAGYRCPGGTSNKIACSNGTYQNSTGMALCKSCSDLSGVSPAGGTYTTSPTSGATANTACRYTAPDKDIEGCATVTTNTVSYTGSAWPATTYNVTPESGWKAVDDGTKDATCELNQFTVTLDRQNGTGGTKSVIATYGEAMPEALMPTRAKYVFNGYYDEQNGSGTQYYDAAGKSANEWDKTSDATLYASWSLCEACTNDTGAADCSVSVTNNVCEYTSGCADGYKDSSCDQSTGVCTCEPITYKIEFTKLGSTGGTPSTDSVTCTFGQDCVLATRNTLYSDSAIFLGWQTDDGLEYEEAEKVRRLTTTDGATIQMHPRWGTGICDIGTGVDSATYVVDSSNQPRCDATCAYGYSKDGGADRTKEFSVAGTGEVDEIIDTQCFPTTTTITLDAQNGVVQKETVVATYGEEMPDATIPGYAGYTFGGYYTQAAGSGTQYYTYNGRSARNWDSEDETDTLYAKWTANQYTIKFTTDGSTGGEPSKNSVTCTFGQDCTLATRNTLYSSSSVFLGWENEDNGTDYDAGDTVKNLTTTSGGTVTMNPRWGAGSCTKGTGVDTATYSVSSSNVPSCAVTCSTGYSEDGGTDTTNTFTVTGTAGSTAAIATSCALREIGCNAGYYLKKNETTCTKCFSPYYCLGGDFDFSTTTDQGLSSCGDLTGADPTGGTYYSVSPFDKATTCYYTAKNKTITNCKTVTVEDSQYNGTRYPATVYSVTPNTGYHAVNNNTTNPTCEINTYTVNFVATPGSGSADPATKTCTYGQPCNAAQQGSMTNGDKLFNGWAKTQGATSVAFAAGQNMGNLTSTHNATVPIYAVWSADGCPACTPGDGAGCNSLGVVNNQCAYEAWCLPGNGNLTGDGTATPDCSPCSASNTNGQCGCADGTRPDGDGGCTSCTIQCSAVSSTYPLGSFNECNGGTKNTCYRNCTSSDIANGTAFTGSVTLGGSDTCKVTQCATDYYVINNGAACEECPPHSINCGLSGDPDGFSCESGYHKNAAGDACEPNAYTITLKKNGGTGTINGTSGTADATITCYHNEPCNLPTSGLTRANYNFGGWGTSSSCSSGKNQETFTANATRYACWTQGSVTCEAGKMYNGTAMEQCKSGWYCPGTGSAPMGVANGCAVACDGGTGSDLGATKKTQCYKLHENMTDNTTPSFSYGVADILCYWDASQGAYIFPCTTQTVKSCVGGHWQGTSLSSSCPSVDPLHYSPNGATAQTACAPGATSMNADEAAGNPAVSATQCLKQCVLGNVAHRDETIPYVATPPNAKGTSDGKGYETCNFEIWCEYGYRPENNNSPAPTCVGQEFDIKLYKNDGTNTVAATVSCAYDRTDCVLSSMSGLTHTGYSAANQWCTSANGGTCYAAGGAVSGATLFNGDASVALYAKWTPNVYTVQLDDNDGSGSAPKTVYVKFGDKWYSNSGATTAISKLTTNPTKSGFNFAGYFAANDARVIDANGNFINDTASTTAISTNNAKITAKWTDGLTTCQPGYYYPGTGTSCSACKTGYWCGGGDFATNGGEDGLSTCPPSGTSAGGVDAKDATACYMTGLDYTATHGTGTQTCYYSTATGTGGTYSIKCTNKVITKCTAGYWRQNASDTDCVPVTDGWYSDGTGTTRSECAAYTDAAGQQKKGKTGTETATRSQQCFATGLGTYKAVAATGTETCSWNGTDKYDQDCKDPIVTNCVPGYWLDTNDISYSATKPDCVSVKKGYYGPVAQTGTGYMIARSQCPKDSTGVNGTTASDTAGQNATFCYSENEPYETQYTVGVQKCNWSTAKQEYGDNCSVQVTGCTGGYWLNPDNYDPLDKNPECEPVGVDYYSPYGTGDNTKNGDTKRTPCPTYTNASGQTVIGTTNSATTSSSATACYKDCPANWDILSDGDKVGTAVQVNAQEKWNATSGAYPACTYTANCNTDWTPFNSPGQTPSCIYNPGVCPENHYCDPYPVPCPNGGLSKAGDTALTQCYKITENATDDTKPVGFTNGVADIMCYWSGTADAGDYNDRCESIKDRVKSCIGGYWHDGTNRLSCIEVADKMFSEPGWTYQESCAPGAAYSTTVRDSHTKCAKQCVLGTVEHMDTSVAVVTERDYVPGKANVADGYEDCNYTIKCLAGYTPSGENVPAPTCVANKYTITYDKGDGTGTVVGTTECTYDSKNCKLAATSSLTRRGFSAVYKWCKADGTTCYTAGAVETANISTGEPVTLYAQWTPNVYTITLDKNTGTTDATPNTVYLKFATGWYSDAAATNAISKLTTLPTKNNGAYLFGGFATTPSGEGVSVIGADGTFVTNTNATTAIAENAKVYARWSQGSVSCNPGYYYAGSGPDCTPCEANHWCPGGSGFATDSQVVGGLNACEAGGTSAGGVESDTAWDCVKTVDYRATHGGGTQVCHYDTASAAYNKDCSSWVINTCDAGYWFTTDSQLFPAGYNPANGLDCVPVGDGWYSMDTRTDRYQCVSYLDVDGVEQTAQTGTDTAAASTECYATNLGGYENTNVAAGTQSCKWNGLGQYNQQCWDKVITQCSSGYWVSDDSADYPENYDATNPICVSVKVGYYGPVKNDASTYITNRAKCPDVNTALGLEGVTASDDAGQTINDCYSVGDPYEADHAVGVQSCDWNDITKGYVNSCRITINGCAAGYSDPNYTLERPDCEAVGVGFWSAGGDSATPKKGEMIKHACEIGTLADGSQQKGTTAPKTTAASADECYLEQMFCQAGGGTGTTTCHYDTDSYTDCAECEVQGCPAGTKLVDNACVECAPGEICPGPGIDPTYCRDLENGRYPNSDAGISDAKYCYGECDVDEFNNAYAMDPNGRDYLGADVADTCQIMSCDGGYKLNDAGTACVKCGEGEICPSPTPDDPTPQPTTCTALTNGGYPFSDAGSDSVDDCYRNCVPANDYTTVSGRDYYGSDVKDTCVVTECAGGWYQDGLECIECPAGMVCEPGKQPYSCPPEYPNSDAGTSSQDMCYTTCKVVPPAFEMVAGGRDYMGANVADTCQILSCHGGYKLNAAGTACVQCGEGEICPEPEPGNPNPTPTTCTELTGDWPLSAAGSSKKEQCYRKCETYDVENGVATPGKPVAYWPEVCVFSCRSETGNLGTVENGVCVEKSCYSNYEMIDGKCQLCNRENAISYKQTGNCNVDVCVAGFHPEGDQCKADVRDCVAPNALVAQQTWDAQRGAFGICMIKECVEGYHVESNACESNVQPCNIENGVGTHEWNPVKKTWGECVAVSCNPGYTSDMSEMDTRGGVQACGRCRNAFGVDGEIAVEKYRKGCEIASCRYQGQLYDLQNNECVPICEINGYEDETGYRYWDRSRQRCVHECAPGYMMW